MRLILHDKNCERGTVLLEVVLALVLFAAAAAIISSGLNASLNSAERLRLNAHAANLAVSVVSELQMGIKTIGREGAQPFQAPFEGWTWEVSSGATPDSESSSSGGITKVEVIIRHNDPELVYRLSQSIQLNSSKTSERFADALDRRHFTVRTR